MKDIDLENCIKSLNARFNHYFSHSDWKCLKAVADLYLDLFKRLYYRGTKISTRINNLRVARSMLGIACELLVKSVYLKKGYQINALTVKRSMIPLYLKKRYTFPYKLNRLPKKYISDKKTFTFYQLNDGLRKVLGIKATQKQRFNERIKLGLEIARVWRNKEVHLRTGYHFEKGTHLTDVGAAVLTLYSVIYKETPSFPRMRLRTQN